MKTAGNKLINVLLGIVGAILLLQLIMSAVQPYLHVIGFVLTSALIGGVVGGIGFVSYRVYQNHRGGGTGGM